MTATCLDTEQSITNRVVESLALCALAHLDARRFKVPAVSASIHPANQ